MRADVVIIGAGASGLICAMEAGRRGRSVIILDHNDRAGKKILVSGGGRCNFTNLHVGPEDYYSSNPHFCKSALAGFRPASITDLLDRHGVKYYEKEDGQLFCRTSSRNILNLLIDECGNVGTRTILGCKIHEVARDDLFRLKTSKGDIEGRSLVVATGGLSYPSLGATDLGHKIAAQFGIGMVETRPALVPFTLSRRDMEIYKDLSGVSLPIEVRVGKERFRGKLLFTHRGLSGPAILQASLTWRDGMPIFIDLLPDLDILDLLMSKRDGKMELKKLLSAYIPASLAGKWCKIFMETRPMNSYSNRELKEVSEMLHSWEIRPAGTEGYKTAEVTAGGVDTKELSSTTMESKKIPSLYFIGEVVDVTGRLGGYNLHWAWASGFAAGQYA